MERVYIFDTTLRDGGQTKGVDFSFADKIAISEALDDLGIDYIEGGWPGANPTDDKLFGSPPKLKVSNFVAFGMTRRPNTSAANDPGLNAVLSGKSDSVCLVGKTWDFHVSKALNITLEENIDMISESINETIDAEGEIVELYAKLKDWRASALAGYARKVGVPDDVVDPIKRDEEDLLDEIMGHLFGDDWMIVLMNKGLV